MHQVKAVVYGIFDIFIHAIHLCNMIHIDSVHVSANPSGADNHSSNTSSPI